MKYETYKEQMLQLLAKVNNYHPSAPEWGRICDQIHALSNENPELAELFEADTWGDDGC